MGLKKKLLFIFCFVGSGTIGYTEELSWKEIVELAQKNSLELQSSILTYESTKALEISARSGFFPKLSASATNSQSGGEALNFSNAYSTQLNISQNIFAGFSDLNQFRQSKSNSEQSLANLNLIKAKLSSQLKQALATYFYSLESKKLASDIVKRRDDNLKNVDLRFQSGRENKGSVLLSKSYLDEAKYDLQKANHDAEVSGEDLKRLLGLSSEEVIALTDAIPNLSIGKEIPNFQKLSQQTPDVIALSAQEQSADYEVEMAKSSFVPSLDVSGNYGYTDSKFFPQKDRWTVGLTLSVPLFDGGRDYSSLKSASYRYQAYGRQRSDLLQKNVIVLKSAYFEFLASIEKEKLDESFKEAVLIRAQIARSKYNNGLTTFDEWDRVESDLISRQRASLNSRRDRILKEALWEQAQGIGVFQ